MGQDGPAARRLALRRGVVAASTAALCALLLLGAAVPAAASGEGLRLRADATGPLFDDEVLAPGRSEHRCVALDWSGGAATAVATAQVSGDLAPHLRVRMETGRGGGYAGCSGFVAEREVFAGTLAELGQVHTSATGPIPLAAATEPSGAVVVRVSVELLDVAAVQGLQGSATFSFGIRGSDPAGPTEEPGPVRPPGPAPEPSVPEPSVTAAPSTPPRPAGPDPGGDDPGGPAADPTGTGTGTVGPASTGSAASTGGPVESVVQVPMGPGDPGGASPAGEPTVLTALGEAVDRIVTLAGKAALPLARSASWGLGALPVLLLFLAVQHRIDARDPKLAHAPDGGGSLPFDDHLPSSDLDLAVLR